MIFSFTGSEGNTNKIIIKDNFLHFCFMKLQKSLELQMLGRLEEMVSYSGGSETGTDTLKTYLALSIVHIQKKLIHADTCN